MKRNRAVLPALVGLFLWATACTSWTPIGISEVVWHDRVRVTLTDGRREILHDPSLTASSIQGNTGPPQREVLSVAQPEVESVEGREMDVAGTVTASVGGTLLFLIALAFYGSQ